MRKHWWSINRACAVLFAALGAAAAGADAQPSGAHASQTAAAHQQNGADGRARLSFPDLSRWNQAELRGGYSVNRLIGLRLRDRNGESIGKIDDLLMNNRGRITAVAIESGGLMGIGERHFKVPWNEVQISVSVDDAIVPVARHQPEKRAREEPPMRNREYRITSLLDDTVHFGDGTRFARLDDLIITRDGEVKALVADAGGFGPFGRYAFPYRRDAHDLERGAYRVPYDRTQVGNARPFDYTAVSIAAPAARGTGVTDSRPGNKEERYESGSRSR
jgi:sporulation protein YlmC with PRC-barrel domain